MNKKYDGIILEKQWGFSLKIGFYENITYWKS